jgi:ABC-type sugar transport system ATPase subunit
MSRCRQPILEATGVCKRFGHVQALLNVDIEVWDDEVLALVGDNGAGKSTLIKILSGAYALDDGVIRIYGEERRFHTPHDAGRAGIATLYQDLALVEMRSVAANLFLGREPSHGPFVDRRRVMQEARRVIAELRADIPSVSVPVAMLSGGQRQVVAIGRALVQGGELIIMDEPTAALGVAESKRVLDLVDELRSRGKSVLIVSHNLEHVWRVADRIVVLNRGVVVGARRRDETTVEEIVRMIVYGSAAATEPMALAGGAADDD